MKYLITGMAGFIGSHLGEHLEVAGHTVIGLDDFSHASKSPYGARSRKFDVASGINERDLRDYVRWADVVFHLAAQIHVDKGNAQPHDTVKRNINGTLNVLEAVRSTGTKMVFASSSEVYGTSQEERMAETHQLDAQSVYAASKVGADRLCKAYIDTFDCDICILRNFNTFGAWQNDGCDGASYGAVIGIFTRAALRGDPITVFGDGEQSRDYMSVGDAVQAYKIAEGYTGVLNAGSGATISINELAQRINTLCGNKSEIVHVKARPGEVRRLCADTTRIESLGFKSNTDFTRDLAAYIDWYNGQHKTQ